ncbi:MAG: hypothetical protein ACRD33_00655 [Candidatus Acidiferrales bacterium]
MPETHSHVSHQFEQVCASRPDFALLDTMLYLEMHRFFQADRKTVEPETTLALATLRRIYIEVKAAHYCGGHGERK